MRIKTLVAGAVAAPVLVLAGTGSAFAGEIAGPPSGEYATGGNTPIADYVANSICAFSGLNAPHPGDKPDGAYGGKHVQSYGAIVSLGGKADAPSPGDACNGHTGELAGGGPVS